MAYARARASRRRRRPAVVLVAGIALSILMAPAEVALFGPHAGDVEAGTAWRFSPSERCFLKRINRRRVHHGRRRLDWDKQMGVVARRHARRIARAGGVHHDTRIGRKVTRWVKLGQNTGRGGRCRGLFRAFWRSSAHRGNILGRWRFVAVGARRRGGRLYVQQIFEARRNPGNVWRYP
ncbi:MAG: CAP domain-containing protein [Actinomycetota bacterium]